MANIKVAVVDDSAFMRKILSDILNSHHEIEVIAKFRNGKDLIEQFYRYNPDIITLDVEMPILNGVDTLKQLKNSGIKCPVIMLSSLTGENSAKTLECLDLGAVDFIEKPVFNHISDNHIFNELMFNKILAIAKKGKENGFAKKSTKATETMFRETTIKETTFNETKHLIKAVVIGASTGGPKALQKVLVEINENIGVPVFVVQHMPKGFTKAFADRLNGICKLKTVEAANGMPIEINTIYIAQGGYHMTVGKDNKIWLNEEPTIWGVRPAVDKLFESAVNVYGGNLLSVILTGMGRDGANGTAIIKNSGGITISEDESTCTIYGMPKAAYETGKVDMVLQLQLIANKINTLVKGR
ncbi:chemotaxis response regulator protein-glutamate methylesterase [Clostridium sp. SHJSY1]|uniref:protein-glutamate methylesterase/protein-glutamine glutaminase n=1 Tax=Clostridium sp. SHJSY1 TaxID=2942483 RepID=UPI0028749EB2|nr:chemotaxis response regulator protein-glutamate methylesterase [Clostridium sp. SHJSY1]MDS0524134.1 chemotaxis response regulator protein-glutamate methylesterase [Clostridium sp. SHJSY1]